MGVSAEECFVYVVLVTCVIMIVVESSNSAPPEPSVALPMTMEEKKQLREKTLEMFNHAYNAYMDNAFPADELMPLSCKGRYRDTEPSRGDVDDTLGNFTLTLIDTLDTLAILGNLDGFEKAVKNVIRVSRFDTDAVVSVFETNIRILGGLLGGHVAAIYFKRKKIAVQWYQGELLTMAKEVGDRLLPAFNTSTGIPYPRINMRHGITPKIAGASRDTCTSCAGTMILEFAALSRLTGLSVYEEKARKAMDYLWAQRHRSNNLMGMVINIHNGDWIRRESGVGAGIDSYYEYVLKTYVLLGDDTYLNRFNKHYDAVMRYVSQGPLLVDVHMHKPNSAAKNFMDSLLAFWPGLQVLVGDIGPAVETHEMLYQVVQRHNFLPEAFTTDFRVHWAQHPLRPEFLESTYFLYQATSDPYYLDVGKKVLENLEQHARVDCGFAAIKDLKRGTHEDQMDSFVLAETFKYLYLLFSDKEDVVMDVDDFIFTTEAHLLPLTLSVGNYTWTAPRKIQPDIYKFDMMSVAEMKQAAEEDMALEVDDEEFDEERGVCHNFHVTIPEGHGYPHRLRAQLGDLVDKAHPKLKSDRPRLKAAEFVAGNKEHLELLVHMGIRIATMPDGRIQLLHTASEALSQTYADAGLEFMQEMIELSKSQKPESQHQPMYVKLVSPPFNGQTVYRAGPAQFGYDLSTKSPIQGKVRVAKPFKACTSVENVEEILGNIAIIERGDCMFIDKARNLQRAGAIGGIVFDQSEGTSSDMLSLFAMSGDGSIDVTIPLVFLFHRQGQDLLATLANHPELLVELTSDEGSVEDEQLEVPSPTHTDGDNSHQPSGPASSISSSIAGKPTATLPSSPQKVQEAHPRQSSDGREKMDWISEPDYNFYHHDFLDISKSQYILQAGTKFFHLSISVSNEVDTGSSKDHERTLRYDSLPDGSKMFSFFLRYALTKDDGRIEKPNLNEMYLDVIHTIQHHTNFEELERSSDYMKAIARFMESAFFHMDRIDMEALALMSEFNRVIKVRHTYPDGETNYIGKEPNLDDELTSTETPRPAISTYTFKVTDDGVRTSFISEDVRSSTNPDTDYSNSEAEQQHRHKKQQQQNQQEQHVQGLEQEVHSDNVDIPSIASPVSPEGRDTDSDWEPSDRHFLNADSSKEGIQASSFKKAVEGFEEKLNHPPQTDTGRDDSIDRSDNSNSGMQQTQRTHRTKDEF